MRKECNAEPMNKNIITVVTTEAAMPDTKYDKIEITGAEMKICLEFPKKQEVEEEIKQDIKSILSCALRDQLQKHNN